MSHVNEPKFPCIKCRISSFYAWDVLALLLWSSNPNQGEEFSPLSKEVTLKCPLCGRIAPLDVRDYMMRHHKIPKKIDPPKSTWRDRPMRDVYFERRWSILLTRRLFTNANDYWNHGSCFSETSNLLAPGIKSIMFKINKKVAGWHCYL